MADAKDESPRCSLSYKQRERDRRIKHPTETQEETDRETRIHKQIEKNANMQTGETDTSTRYQ